MKEISPWKVNEEEVVSFLKHYTLNRFFVLNYFIFYNESYFTSMKLIAFALEKGIKNKYFANYYLQGNEVA